MESLSWKRPAKSKSGFRWYQSRKMGLPEIIDQRSLPRENTSKFGFTSASIPIAQPGIQLRLPTFSKASVIRSWSSILNAKPQSPRTKRSLESMNMLSGLISL